MVIAGNSGQEEVSRTTGMQNNGDNKEDSVRPPPYQMHGILHYLQHEWSRYEMDRAKWELEKAEMQARIAFLQGERKGQENLKHDLIRRIKMLEYCLKQERAKNYRLTHNGEDPPEFEEAEEKLEPVVPSDVDAYPLEMASASGWKHGRQLLKKYLMEIGYSEQILDVRSFRVKNLLGLISPGDLPSNERNTGKDTDGGSDSDNDFDQNLESAVDVIDEGFSFLKAEKGGDEWALTNQDAINKLKEKYISEKHVQDSKQKKGGSATNGSEKTAEGEEQQQQQQQAGEQDKANLDMLNDVLPMPAGAARGNRGQYVDIDAALGLPPQDEIDIKNFSDDDDQSMRAVKWNLKTTLRSHLDVIRAMQFHPVEPVLITASEDGTAKLWNLEPAKKDEKHNTGGELEPVYTFRSHIGPVLCMDLSPTGDHLYTGGLDGLVSCFNVPSSNNDPHEAYDPRVLSEKLIGHEDAVWSVAYHSSSNRIVSASADSTIKIWEPGNFNEPLQRTMSAPKSGLIPTSVDFVSTEPSQMLAAYTNSFAHIVDLETGSSILNFDFGEDVSSTARITRIISHPTMPITIVAGDDRKIRYFDNANGQLIHSSVAHVEGISSLAIDPNGLYLLSGSHDGSLRLWQMEKRICLQEISAHRKKYDASVTSVAFHPSRPLIGSAGADGLAKVYSAQQDS
ncbi:hypothetical protein WR25_07995 [Diploscapter pachys]|uniref:Striatin N-terminal domain-containing protein n=1 Tax=Diploscapter pachys TaxID=2018661 RepID=A0A2A2JPX7_9BILA|nr:hypothetical protein WR25_07995 [Diploscapter pachys]